MGLGLLFIPTISGYWFLTHLYYTRYGMLRDSGYHVLFKSAFSGCLLFAGAYLIIVLLPNPYLSCISEIWKSYVPFDYSGTVVLSFLLGIILPLAINLFYGKEKAMRRTARESGNLIELLIRKNKEDTRELEITTDYAPVIWQSLEESPSLVYEDFRIVIPMSEIVTARIFDPDVYARFKSDSP